MSDALAHLEKQILDFSLSEQIELLTFIANTVHKKTATLSDDEALRRMRETALSTVWEKVRNDTW